MMLILYPDTAMEVEFSYSGVDTSCGPEIVNFKIYHITFAKINICKTYWEEQLDLHTNAE